MRTINKSPNNPCCPNCGANEFVSQGSGIDSYPLRLYFVCCKECGVIVSSYTLTQEQLKESISKNRN